VIFFDFNQPDLNFITFY